MSAALFWFCASASQAQSAEVIPQAASQAAPIDILWHKAMGTSENNEMARDIIALDEGGAVLAYHQNGSGARLRRIDEAGKIIWDMVLADKDEGYFPRLLAITVTEDGSIIGVGHVHQRPAGSEGKKQFQPFAAKISRGGELVWRKHYTMHYPTMFSDVEVTQDGHFIFAGQMGMPYVFFGGGVHVIKTDADGNRLWYKTVGPYWSKTSSIPYYFSSMALDRQDEILINARYGGGKVKTSVHDDMVQILARISQKGQLLSEAKFPGERWEIANDAVVDSGNNMIVGGYKTFEDVTQNGIYLSSFTSSDKVKWETVINEPVTGSLSALKQLENGDLIGAGSAPIASEIRRDDPARFRDIIVVSLSNDGQLLWSKQYSNLAKFGVEAMDISKDGKLWMLGSIGNKRPGAADLYVAKFALKNGEVLD